MHIYTYVYTLLAWVSLCLFVLVSWCLFVCLTVCIQQINVKPPNKSGPNSVWDLTCLNGCLKLQKKCVQKYFNLESCLYFKTPLKKRELIFLYFVFCTVIPIYLWNKKAIFREPYQFLMLNNCYISCLLDYLTAKLSPFPKIYRYLCRILSASYDHVNY